jgi:acyl carrier protein
MDILMNNSLQSKVIDITSKTLNIDIKKISAESDFANDLGADSLDQVELIMAIEAEFSCEIPDEDASTIRTIKDAVKYISNSIS